MTEVDIWIILVHTCIIAINHQESRAENSVTIINADVNALIYCTFKSANTLNTLKHVQVSNFLIVIPTNMTWLG